MVFQLLLVIGNIFAKYQYLGQDAFIRETTLIVICSLLQNPRFCPTLKSAVLSHLRNPRFFLIFEIRGFFSFKIDCFVLHPFWNIGYYGIGYFGIRYYDFGYCVLTWHPKTHKENAEKFVVFLPAIYLFL